MTIGWFTREHGVIVDIEVSWIFVACPSPPSGPRTTSMMHYLYAAARIAYIVIIEVTHYRWGSMRRRRRCRSRQVSPRRFLTGYRHVRDDFYSNFRPRFHRTYHPSVLLRLVRRINFIVFANNATRCLSLSLNCLLSLVRSSTDKTTIRNICAYRLIYDVQGESFGESERIFGKIMAGYRETIRVNCSKFGGCIAGKMAAVSSRENSERESHGVEWTFELHNSETREKNKAV